MVSFDVKPSLRLSGPIDNPTKVDASVTVSTKHKDLDVSLKVTDRAVKDGLKKQGISLTVERKKNFKLEYDVGLDAPTVTLETSATVSDKNVGIKYKHAAKTGAASVEASVDVIDKHSATVVYNLNGFTLDHRRATLKWKYEHDSNLTIEPSFDFNSEKVNASATYKIDRDNKVKATYDQASNGVAVEVTHTGIKDTEIKLNASTGIDKIDPRIAVTADRTFSF